MKTKDEVCDLLSKQIKKRVTAMKVHRRNMKAAASLEDKISHVKTVGIDENDIRKMRLSIFDAEDGVDECIAARTVDPFEKFKLIFPDAHECLKEMFAQLTESPLANPASA